MNFPRIAAAAIVAWAVSLPVGYFVNTVLLADVTAANQAALRSESALMSNLPVGFAFLLVGFFAFAYAFAKGYEGTDGVMEGVRFGVLAALMVIGFGIIWVWVQFPINVTMTAALMIDLIAELALYGGIVGAIYRPLAANTAKGAAAM